MTKKTKMDNLLYSHSIYTYFKFDGIFSKTGNDKNTD